MTKRIELIAGYWTLAGDCYAMGPSEVATFPLKERIEAASWAGYTGMGLVHQDLLFNKAKYGYPTIKRMLKDNGIKHIEVEFLGNWFETGAKKAESDEVKQELLEAAAELGARDLKVAGAMWTDSCDVPRYVTAFAKVCEDAQKIGVDVAIEVLPMTNIRTLETGSAIVSGAGFKNGGLCIDIWHMTRGGIDFKKVAALPVQYFKSVELNDAKKEIVGTIWEDTLFHRLYPGEGDFDCKSFIGAVKKAGFRGAYGVEVINEDYRKLPLKEQAKRSFDGTMAQFEKLEV